MNCQICHSPVQTLDGHLLCVQCETVCHQEFRFQGQDTAFICPVCREPNLQIAVSGETQVCACPQCSGFVIDSDSLARVIQGIRKEYVGKEQISPFDSSQLDEIRNCPACFQQMQTHPYYGPGNAVIDSCIHCQLTWLDGTELTKIKIAPGIR